MINFLKSVGRGKKRYASSMKLELKLHREMHLTKNDVLHINVIGLTGNADIEGEIALIFGETCIFRPDDVIQIEMELSPSTVKVQLKDKG